MMFAILFPPFYMGFNAVFQLFQGFSLLGEEGRKPKASTYHLVEPTNT